MLKRADKMTPEMVELADADTALDRIEDALRAATDALKHIALSPKDRARIGVAVIGFADALVQQDVAPKKKRVGKNVLRTRLREIADTSSGYLASL